MKFKLNSRLSLYSSILLAIFVSLFLSWSAAKSWFSYIYAGDPPPGGFTEAIGVEGDNSQLYFLLAQFYENYDFTVPRGDIQDLYRKALELNPLNYNYWYYLAEFLSTEGKRDLALFSLNQATELAPGVVSLRWAAGILASRLGEPIEREALERLRRPPVLWWEGEPEPGGPEADRLGVAGGFATEVLDRRDWIRGLHAGASTLWRGTMGKPSEGRRAP